MTTESLSVSPTQEWQKNFSILFQSCTICHHLFQSSNFGKSQFFGFCESINWQRYVNLDTINNRFSNFWKFVVYDTIWLNTETLENPLTLFYVRATSWHSTIKINWVKEFHFSVLKNSKTFLGFSRVQINLPLQKSQDSYKAVMSMSATCPMLGANGVHFLRQTNNQSLISNQKYSISWPLVWHASMLPFHQKSYRQQSGSFNWQNLLAGAECFTGWILVSKNPQVI